MHTATAGTTTIEALIALTVLSAGVLGAAGTVALSLRASRDGDEAAQAAWLAGYAMTEIHARLDAAGGRCDAALSGTLEGTGGRSVRWSLQPLPRGRQILIEISYSTVRAQRRDSLWSFVRCV
jgi:hypothetical protein